MCFGCFYVLDVVFVVAAAVRCQALVQSTNVANAVCAAHQNNMKHKSV